MELALMELGLFPILTWAFKYDPVNAKRTHTAEIKFLFIFLDIIQQRKNAKYPIKKPKQADRC
jgi:hypothetical protein